MDSSLQHSLKAPPSIHFQELYGEGIKTDG